MERKASKLQRTGPQHRWLLHDVFLGAIVSLALFGSQYWVDERRATREAAAAAELQADAERRENVRFVRERSSAETLERPFSRIDVMGQNLSGLNLGRADFREASLIDTDFTGSDLSFADFAGALMMGTDFNYATLQGSNFSCEDAPRLTTCNSVTTGVTFFGSDLRDADLSGVSLFGAWFTEDAKLAGADFSDATFAGAKLFGVDLSKSELRGADFSGSCYSDATRWPSDFAPPPSAEPESCR